MATTKKTLRSVKPRTLSQKIKTAATKKHNKIAGIKPKRKAK